MVLVDCQTEEVQMVVVVCQKEEVQMVVVVCQRDQVLFHHSHCLYHALQI